VPGRNPDEAWREFREPLKRAVGAVDLSVRLRERRFENEQRLLASPVTGIPFGQRLSLLFSLTLEPIEESGLWRMTTRRYDFSIVEASTTNIVFGWHWHPFSRRSQVTYPHVHVPSASQFKTRHIPTGRVSLEDVILFGFDELGVEPAYKTGRDIVIAVRDRHKQHRSWS